MPFIDVRVTAPATSSPTTIAGLSSLLRPSEPSSALPSSVFSKRFPSRRLPGEPAAPWRQNIVGGLLGGWLAVEIAKRSNHIRSRTGDLFAGPLCVGIAIGRIGCFLAGLADDTYGTPTSLPWAVDFGDGIPRHPTQLYEILFLIALAIVLYRYNRRSHPEGATFRLFLAAYLAWRLIIDFIKPQPLHYGLNLIQWACLAGLFALAPSILELFSFQGPAVRSSQ